MVNNMKKICLITDGTMPVPATKGGAVETLIDILVEQNEIQKKVLFTVVSVENTQSKILSQKYKYTQFIYIPRDNKVESSIALLSRICNKLSKIIRRDEIICYSAFYRKTLRKIKKMDFDYIICEGNPQLAKFSYFLKNYNPSQLCVHLHGNCFPSKLVSKTFNTVIGVSNFISNEYKSTCTNKKADILTVYNCVNEKLFHNRLSANEILLKRNELGFKEDDFIVLYCGRICAEKGVLELIRAIVSIDKHIKLLIIGSHNYAMNQTSNYLKEVESLIRKYPNKIKFTGYIENKNVWIYHQCADCMAVPSMWEEPAALTLIEGLTSGLPLVVTDSGGMIEEVDENCAIIVRRKNVVNELSNAFQLLSNNKQLLAKMGLASFERSKFFSREKFYKDYIEIFERK